MATSPRRTFKGYKFNVALARNKNEIKAIVAIIGGVNFAVGFSWHDFFTSLAAGVLALVVKLIGDAVDYYCTDVTIPDPVPVTP
jgi:hypothetical protein